MIKKQKEIDLLTSSSIKNLEIYFNEKENIIEYNEYFFNNAPFNFKINENDDDEYI